jgi:hypothetical protein
LYAAEPRQEKRVLVLLAERKDLPAQQLTVKAVRSALESSERFAVELFTEYMDLSRFTEPQYKEALARLLAVKYSGAKPDLIITVYPLALDFMVNYGHRVFSGTPIVAATIYVGIELPRIARELSDGLICHVINRRNGKQQVADFAGSRHGGRDNKKVSHHRQDKERESVRGGQVLGNEAYREARCNDER